MAESTDIQQDSSTSAFLKSGSQIKIIGKGSSVPKGDMRVVLFFLLDSVTLSDHQSS